MKKEEELAEKVMTKAFYNGGDVYVCDIEFELEELDDNLLINMNQILSKYGEIHGECNDSTWAGYKLNAAGYSFMREGGFKGSDERAAFESKLKKLQMDNLELSNKELKKSSTRSWIAIGVSIASFLISLAAMRL